MRRWMPERRLQSQPPRRRLTLSPPPREFAVALGWWRTFEEGRHADPRMAARPLLQGSGCSSNAYPTR